jgi:hypothetical protein
MKRFVAALLALVCVAGCHAPKPSFDLLTPFGTTRVPPPGTTNYSARNGSYYKSGPSTQAPAGAVPSTGLPATPNTTAPGTVPQRTQQTAVPSSQTLAGEAIWRSPNSKSTVANAAYNAPLTAATNLQTPVGTGVIGTTSAASPSGPKLNGMAVNDATKTAGLMEPNRFQPASDAKELAQLPKPTGNATGTAVAKEVVSSAQASDQVKAPAATAATAASDGSTLNWRTRGS